MSNRRYTANEQLRARSDYGSRPSPGVGGQSVARSNKESPVPYPGAPGPKGPGWKPARLGFNEVKVHVKQDMADDIYGDGPSSLGGPLPLPDMSQTITSGPIPIGGLHVPPDMNPAITSGPIPIGGLHVPPDMPPMPGRGFAPRPMPIGRGVVPRPMPIGRGTRRRRGNY